MLKDLSGVREFWGDISKLKQIALRWMRYAGLKLSHNGAIIGVVAFLTLKLDADTSKSSSDFSKAIFSNGV